MGGDHDVHSRSNVLRLVARWSLWRLPTPALSYVLAVEFGTAVLIGMTARQPVTTEQWLCGGVIAGSALAHLHASHAVERIRRDHSHTPHVDLCGIWIFAGALVLPPLPEALLVSSIYLHRWWLVGRWDASRPPHRALFSTAMLMLAASAAHAIVPDGDLLAHAEGRRFGWSTLIVLLAAAAVMWAVNSGLLAGVITLTVRVRTPRDVLGSGPDNLLELAQMLLGAFVALSVAWWAGFAVLMVLPAVALHRTVLLHQLQLAARTDDKTGLLNATAWYQQAKAELLRTRQRQPDGSLGLLMIDLDHFKDINDHYGHLVGDEVLRHIARVLAAAIRRGDSVGRFGGEEFAVLLPNVDVSDALAVAERIRHCIHELAVTDGQNGSVSGLSVSIGVAIYPQVDEDTVDGLLTAADSALYEAKRAGRDQVQVAGEHRRLRWSPATRKGLADHQD